MRHEDTTSGCCPPEKIHPIYYAAFGFILQKVLVYPRSCLVQNAVTVMLEIISEMLLMKVKRA